MTRMPKPALSSIAAAALALCAAAPAAAAQVDWVLAGNGFWDVAANWSAGVPGAGDDVRIDVAGARVVTLRAGGGPFAVNSLVVAGDDALTITGNTLTLNGLPSAFNAGGTSVLARLTQSGGTVDGAGSLMLGAASFSGNSVHAGSGSTVLQGTTTISGFNLDAGRTLRNDGTATLSGGMNLNASGGANAGTLVNSAGALFDVRTFNLTMSGSDALFSNAGTLRKSTSGTYNIAVRIDNRPGSVVDVQAGSFNFSAGGSHAGSVALAGATTLGFNGGSHAVQAGARFEGAGTLALTGAATVLDLQAPTTVDSAFSMGGGTVQGADLTLTGAVTLAISSSLGVMSGPAVTRLTGSSSVGGGANNPFGLDAGRVLRNEGSMRITGVINLNRLDAAGSGRIDNAAGALIDVVTFNQGIVASAFSGDSGADAQVHNAGTFRMSGSGAYAVAVPFINAAGALIDVSSGSFNFSAGSSHAGSVALAAGTALSLSGGTHDVGAGAVFSGAGTLTLAGAATVLNLQQPARVDSAFAMTGGAVQGAALTLAGPYSLTIASSLGVLRGPATTTLAGDGTVSGGPNNPFGLDAGRVLRNEGTMTITGVIDMNRLSDTGSGRIVNAAGALIDVRTSNQSIYARDWSATNPADNGADARIDNAGTFRKSTSGIYNVLVPFFNTGRVEVLAGGFNMAGFSNAGTLDVAGGATWSGAAFVNSGRIEGNGRVLVSGSGLTNAGVISPGNSPGQLTIDGALQMAAGGVVHIELGGTDAFDLLAVTGNAALAGTLEVVALGGYTPAAGDSFVVMTFNGRQGTAFDDVSFSGFGSGVQWAVTYRDHDVLLGVTAVPEPALGWMLLAGLGVLALRRLRSSAAR